MNKEIFSTNGEGWGEQKSDNKSTNGFGWGEKTKETIKTILSPSLVKDVKPIHNTTNHTESKI